MTLARATRLALVAAGLVLARAPLAAAQTLNGVADWTVTRSIFDSAGQETRNHSLAQSYTFGYASTLWDPRFLRYNAEMSLHKNGLESAGRKGRSRTLGYNLVGSFLSARPFPLSIQASRSYGGQAGDFPMTTPVRGGVSVGPDGASSLDTLVSSFGVNWVFALENRPRFEVAYHKGSSVVSAGPFETEQRDSNLSATMTRETATARHGLRVQRTAYDNLLSDTFKERLTDAGYETTRTLSARAMVTARAGYRRTFSMYDIAPQYTDVGRGAYLPPQRGNFSLSYAVGSLSYRVAERLTTELTSSYDHGVSSGGTSGSLLMASSARYEVFKGLTFSGTANAGIRQQTSEGRSLSIRTRNLLAGADYVFPFEWVHASIGGDRGAGWNTTTEGEPGRSQMWTARTGVSARLLRRVQVAAGREIGRSDDELLSFGNYRVDRSHASGRAYVGSRFALDTSWEVARSQRGGADHATDSRYRMLSASLLAAAGEHRRVAFTFGEYRNESAFGRDQNRYTGTNYIDAYGRLRLWLSLRREVSRLEISRMRQDGYYTVAQIEYRLRLFAFGIEHRYTTLDVADRPLEGPFGFTGKQLLVRVIRKFGIDMGGQ